MRTLILIPVLFVVLMAAGCSRSGDFGAFLVTEVTRYGGHAQGNQSLPRLDASWAVKSDSNGFTATVTGTTFPKLDAFMNQAFGKPKVSVEQNTDGQPQRVYGATDIGVAIQCVGHGNQIEIICLRGQGKR